MSVNVDIRLTVSRQTARAVQNIDYPQYNHELLCLVASETASTIITALQTQSEKYPDRYRPRYDDRPRYNDQPRYDNRPRYDSRSQVRRPRLINIVVESLADGSHESLDIMSNATGRELACYLHDQFGFPLLKQVLMFNGKLIFRRDSSLSIDAVLDQVSHAGDTFSRQSFSC